jgi:hypothetical protein
VLPGPARRLACIEDHVVGLRHESGAAQVEARGESGLPPTDDDDLVVPGARHAFVASI